MRWLRKLRALFRRDQLDAEMREEMRAHIEQLTERNRAAGLAPGEARSAALREFGNVANVQEQVRERRGWLWLEQVAQDARYAGRSLGKSPGFTVVALVTLALGIGVNTTSFSVLAALLLHTPPYPQPDAIVRVYQTSPYGFSSGHSPANFRDYRAQNTVFAPIAALQNTSFNLGDPGQPADRLRGLCVSADFFAVLGLAPELGRTFTADEEREGNNAVVILSHGTWTRRFAGDPTIIGRTLRLDAGPVTVVGVMPATADDPLVWSEVAAWRPLTLSDKTWAHRDNATLSVVARIKAGLTQAQAEEGMKTVAARLALAWPQFNTDRSLRLVPLGRSTADGTTRSINRMTMSLAGFVLLIACANLANLQFARNSARAREYAVRLALGASRSRLMRLVLAEGILLALAGGGLALLLAVWANDLVGRTFDLGGGATLAVPLDGRVLVFTSLVSLATGVGFGLLPAWLASRASVGDALKQGGRSATGGRSQHRLRAALIVAEVALALVLLAGAGFFVRGLQRCAQRDPGWQVDNLLTADLSLRGANYANPAIRDSFYRRLQERLLALPGVEQAALARSLPTAGYSNGNTFVVEGRPEPAADRSPSARVSGVSPGYFATLGIRLLQGRDFTAADDATKPPVVIINESMARQLWPGENPIGKRIGGATPFMSSPREVIGVVSDVRAVANFDNVEGRFQFYRALAQWSVNSVSLALRSHQAVETLAPDLRRIVAELDSDQAVSNVETVRTTIDRNLGSIAAAGTALVCFAALGVLLAAIGIYGVIANSVFERTNEIGIRLALGAQIRDIFALVIGGGLRLTLLGAALGLLGAAGIPRLLRAISPEFSTVDVGLTACVTLGLILVAAFACWLPARRATKVDPLIALRTE